MTTEHEPPNDLAAAPTGAALPAAHEVAALIRAGGWPHDELFDRFLPPRLRQASGVFWTPLVVAARAAAWFAEQGIGTVVDIGSGAGKFCVAAALGGDCRFIGLEHRQRLVTAADAYYLYNPFAESRFGPESQLDADVELGEECFHRDVTATDALLRGAPRGTYVVTYNGFGGRVPESYEKVRVDRTLPNMLRMFRKAG